MWQNNQDLLRATAVTRGSNGYRNKSQHRKSTLEKKLFPPFLLVCPLLFFLLLLFSVSLLRPEEDNFLSKVLVCYCFLVFRRIGEYVSLDLFYFVNLTSSCSLIPGLRFQSYVRGGACVCGDGEMPDGQTVQQSGIP